MDNKKMVVHPALTEFALQSAKDWEAVAQERLGVIERLCMEVERLTIENQQMYNTLFCLVNGVDHHGWCVGTGVVSEARKIIKERQ